MNESPILSGTGLTKKFLPPSGKSTSKIVTALDDVSITLMSGESHGIAGESGCGKSTLAKILSGLMQPDHGTVHYKGTALADLKGEGYSLFRRTAQMIFQDPFSSLNPRMRIGDSIIEPLHIMGMSRELKQEELQRIMTAVGLDPDSRDRFPDEFSGGQRQRIGIARALSGKPEILIADEPVSSLDISIQAQIINLLLRMKQNYNFSMLIISHNLMVLRHICDRITIMYLGAVMESAPASDLFIQCRHPYTEALLSAIPGFGKKSSVESKLLHDDLPSPTSVPTGCRFHPRCRYAVDICRREVPTTVEFNAGHTAACHLSKQIFG